MFEAGFKVELKRLVTEARDAVELRSSQLVEVIKAREEPDAMLDHAGLRCAGGLRRLLIRKYAWLAPLPWIG